MMRFLVGNSLKSICLALVLFAGMWTQWAAAQTQELVARTKLPTTHEYQRTLRDFLGTLKEADFEHGVMDKLSVAEAELTGEEMYRHFVMTKMLQPLVGWKRGTPAVNAPSWLFLLSTIEGPVPPPETEQKPPVKLPQNAREIPVPIRVPSGIVVPPVWPETLTAFVQWKHPGNPYFDNRGLKMRAFVTAVVKMIMLDDYFKNTPNARRADFNGYKLACFGSTYLGVKDVLPSKARKAFETGLLKLGREMMSWGIKGETVDADLSAAIGFSYVARACEDANFAREAEARGRQLMTDPKYFDPAGHWMERGGGLDVGYGGSADRYVTWAALMTDWSFAKENVERACRLRSHLTMRDPDGFLSGPSHFNSRIGRPAFVNQSSARDLGAAMITDEATCFVKIPTEEELSGALTNRAKWFNFQIRQNQVRPDLLGGKTSARTGYWANEDLRGRTWTWRLWQTYNFPIGINFAHQFYQNGAWAHLHGLRTSGSPMLKTPFERGENFVRRFGHTFVVAREDGYGVILHTGPVGQQLLDDGMTQYPGPLGFGGGQLSAFWTPKTGSVIQGRRIAVRSDVNYDTLESWRQWPVHAVSGLTTSGAVISSSRIIKPDVAPTPKDGGVVSVSGEIPAVDFEQKKTLSGRIGYKRVFRIQPDGLRIETTITSDGKDDFAELYETLPVFLREARRQVKTTPTSIEWEIDGLRTPATAEFSENVSAVLLKRFDGVVRITFDQPQRVKLSPEDWADTFVTRATCRNVMIDLRKSSHVNYTIR